MSVVYNIVYNVTAMAAAKFDIFFIVIVLDKIIKHIITESNNIRGTHFFKDYLIFFQFRVIDLNLVANSSQKGLVDQFAGFNIC